MGPRQSAADLVVIRNAGVPPPKTRVQTNWCLSVREEWVKQCMKNMDSGEQLHRLLPCFRDGSRRYELLVEQIWLFGLFL